MHASSRIWAGIVAGWKELGRPLSLRRGPKPFGR